MPRIPIPLKDRLEEKLQVNDKTGCIEFTGSLNPNGYGQIGAGRRAQGLLLAHRAAWLVHYGSMPTQNLCHTCDNPKCCNVDHLFEGDHTVNSRDKTIKGRHHNVKVTEEMYKRMVEMHKAGAISSVIAKEIGLNRSTVSRHLRGDNGLSYNNPHLDHTLDRYKHHRH
jgi:HNH endonuclease